MKNTFDRVTGVLVEFLDVSSDEVKRSSHLKHDLGADSLDMVQIMMALEEEFGLEVPDEEAEALETVGRIVDYVDSKTATLVAVG